MYDAQCSSMLLEWPAELARYPAHLHVHVLPEYQKKKGGGTQLVHGFCEAVREKGAVGVHLDMVARNAGERAFYERLGFGVCGQVLDGGESGKTGVNGDVSSDVGQASLGFVRLEYCVMSC